MCDATRRGRARECGGRVREEKWVPQVQKEQWKKNDHSRFCECAREEEG